MEPEKMSEPIVAAIVAQEAGIGPDRCRGPKAPGGLRASGHPSGTVKVHPMRLAPNIKKHRNSNVIHHWMSKTSKTPRNTENVPAEIDRRSQIWTDRRPPIVGSVDRWIGDRSRS